MNNMLDIIAELDRASSFSSDKRRNILKRLMNTLLKQYEPGVRTQLENFRHKHGYTFASAVNTKMNPHAIAGAIIDALGRMQHDKLMKSKYSFGWSLREVIDHISMAQTNGDLVVGRGGKKLKCYPRNYENALATNYWDNLGGCTADEYENIPLHSPYPSATVTVRGTPRHISPTTTTTKEEPTMASFNPTNQFQQVIIIADEMSKHDLSRSIDDPKDWHSYIEDALIYRLENSAFTAEERLSLQAVFDMMADDILAGNAGYEHDALLASATRDALVSDEELALVATYTKQLCADGDGEVVEPVETAPDIDPKMAEVIDTLIDQATDGKMGGIRQTMQDLIASKTLARKLEEEVASLKTRSRIAPVAIEGEAAVDGDKLSYKVVMRMAQDLFPNPKNGRKLPQLKFEIPTVVWTDAEGNEVQHPMCAPIDEHYFFRAEHLLRMCMAFVTGRNVYAHGDTGTGKTTFAEQFYSRVGLPQFRVNLDSAMERPDLTGQVTLVSQDGTTVSKFEEGILPKAMVQPCVLILDELDAGRADLLFVIQRATEGNGLLLTEDNGRLVKPHPLFRFVATANSRGQGDERGIYAGVRPLNGALLNRFGVFIEVDYLKKDEEETVLGKRYPDVDKDTRVNLVQFAESMRRNFRNGEITVPFSPRDMFNVCEMIGFFEPILATKTDALEMALTATVVDRAPLDNRQRVIEIADKHFPSCKFK